MRQKRSPPRALFNFLDPYRSDSQNANLRALDGALGGNFLVPTERFPALFDAIAACVDERDPFGTMMTLVEQKSDPFRFFLDFDLANETGIVLEEALEAARSIAAIVARRTSQDALTCVINTNARIVRGKYKTAMHVHFPSVIVNQQSAVRLWDLICYSLETDPAWRGVGAFAGLDPRAVLDSCVYQANGLRLPYQMKASICTSCRKLKNDHRCKMKNAYWDCGCSDCRAVNRGIEACKDCVNGKASFSRGM